MNERHKRIKKLRSAWNKRKTATESNLGIVTQELQKATGAIEEVSANLGTRENFIHSYQDISFRYLVGMVDLKNRILEKQERLQSKRMVEASNEKMCEIIEGKLKAEIETAKSTAELRTILELLVGAKSSSG